jgi:serine/threonine protein kinase, bacterial
MHQTVNGVPQPASGNFPHWWAFRSTCTPAGCVAAGKMLSDSVHRPGGADLFFRFDAGIWREDPRNTTVPCSHDPASGTYPAIDVVSLTPRTDGTLQGDATTTITSDSACGNTSGMKGTVIQIPVLAKRVSDAPPGVPDPASAPPPPPTDSIHRPPHPAQAPPAQPPSAADSKFLWSLSRDEIYLGDPAKGERRGPRGVHQHR